MKVYEKKNCVILEGVSDFNPTHIFECGQCFRWHKQEDGSYTGVAKGKVINVASIDNKIYLNNTNLEEFNTIWYNYFDLGTNYTEII